VEGLPVEHVLARKSSLNWKAQFRHFLPKMSLSRKEKIVAMFPVESPATLSQDDLVFLEAMFAHKGPTWEETDALLLSDELLGALQDGYSSLFFLLEPDTAILEDSDLDSDRRSFQRFLMLRHPLEAHTLAALHLAPFDAHSIAYVLLPYYRQRYPHLGGEETWAFLKAGSRIMRGVIVHPSTKVKDNRWQLTYFDRDGLDWDETWPMGIDTLLDLFSRRYIIPAPDVVDELAFSWTYYR
jgi:hypothetical protein